MKDYENDYLTFFIFYNNIAQGRPIPVVSTDSRYGEIGYYYDSGAFTILTRSTTETAKQFFV